MNDTQQATERAIAEWLTWEHPVPAQVWTEWTTHGVALLPLGKRFAAVRMPMDVVHAALDTDQPTQVASLLEQLLCGPVVHDRRVVGVTYYALIQWNADLVWAHDEIAPCLGRGIYLGVPRIDRRKPPGTYWVVAPKYAGNLCAPHAVASLIEAGRQRLVHQRSCR
ncbi:hypothetical protein ACFWFF_05185 [Streptomyces sp. NPDC060223]|uniref:hypothetical protein n=1 Tax=unclassified Streptomyces TaxID=2593676 RepID=UPI003643F844